MYSSISGAMRCPSDSRCDLAADHAVDGACGGGDFGEDGDAARRVDGCGGDGFERQGEERVARKYGCGFAEFFVTRGLAAAEVVVVEGGKVIVNQRVGVDEFDGAGGMQRGRNIESKCGRKNTRSFEAENRTNAFAASEDAVAHGLVYRRRRRGCGGHEAVESRFHREAIFFKE
jgi:hypothetical protein